MSLRALILQAAKETDAARKKRLLDQAKKIVDSRLTKGQRPESD